MNIRPSLALIVIFGFALSGSWHLNGQEESKAESGDKLTKLLQERRDTLAKRVAALEMQLGHGELKIDSVIAARGDLLEAELQLAKTKNRRVEIFMKRIDNMRELENSVKLQFENGLATNESYLAATAARLQAEIDLIREQQGSRQNSRLKN